MKRENPISKLYLRYSVVLLPLIIFGIYKNGISLYMKGYVGIIGALKPLIIVLMCVSGTFLGTMLRAKKKDKSRNLGRLLTKNWLQNLIESMIMALAMPIGASPIIVFVIVLAGNFLLNNAKFNKVALIYLIILVFNDLVGCAIFENAYELDNTLNYNGIDLLVGFGLGGMCSTSSLLVGIALLILSFDKFYKREIVLSAIITFLVLGTVPAMINSEYAEILPLVLGFNIMYFFTFCLPDFYSTPYTVKGQILSGIFTGVLAYFLAGALSYYAAPLSILMANLFKGIFDRIFIVK